MSELSPEVARFVDRSMTVRLATISRRGTPMVTPLWFGRDGGVIYLGTRGSSPQARHIRENARVVMLFGEPNDGANPTLLRVVGIGRLRDSGAMSFRRKARLVWRYFLNPAALRHWIAHWRKLGVRRRYYAERTDPVTVEITLDEAEFLTPLGR